MRIFNLRSMLLLLLITIIIIVHLSLTKLESVIEEKKSNIDVVQGLPIYSEGKWQYVGNKEEPKFLVFSAYLDDRKEKYVRVIAAGKTYKPQSVWCKLYTQIGHDHGIENFYIVEGIHNTIAENWELKYSARYVLCPLDASKLIPKAVSVLSNKKENAKNILKVIVNGDRPKYWNINNVSTSVENIGVCVKPFYNKYNEETEIMEFIELHRILGVNHFYFYNHTLGPQVDCILNDYIKEGVATVLNWELSMVSQKEIRTEGMFAALNDCLYRTMQIYSHVLFIDVDEYIMPTKVDNYKELIEHINQDPKIQKSGAFSIQNAFFYRQWPDDENVASFEDELAHNLITLKKTRRRTQLNPHRTRSKFIGRPEMLTMVGNHFIWKYLEPTLSTINVSPDDAIMHHYRVCEFGGDDCITQPSIVDRTVYKYNKSLLNAIRERYKKLKNKCKLKLFLQ